MGVVLPNEEVFIGFSLGPVGAMAAPTGVTATAAAGSGSLPAATYNYVLTGVNDTGETVGSTVATVTTSSTGGVTVGWTTLTGATGYRIYGRNSGAGNQKLITQVGEVTSWLDSGATAPGTAVPPTTGTASNLSSPHIADVAEAIDLTRFLVSANFSATGNTVATPRLSSLFETSIAGTSQATATMDCYRDDEVDTAWQLFPRGTQGYIFVRHFGGMPTAVGDELEVWPVYVTSRSMANLASNTAETFTITFSVPAEPAEDALMVA